MVFSNPDVVIFYWNSYFLMTTPLKGRELRSILQDNIMEGIEHRRWTSKVSLRHWSKSQRVAVSMCNHFCVICDKKAIFAINAVTQSAHQCYPHQAKVGTMMWLPQPPFISKKISNKTFAHSLGTVQRWTLFNTNFCIRFMRPVFCAKMKFPVGVSRPLKRHGKKENYFCIELLLLQAVLVTQMLCCVRAITFDHSSGLSLSSYLPKLYYHFPQHQTLIFEK